MGGSERKRRPHVVDAVQPPVGQRRPLLQPQVPAEEQLGCGDRRGLLHVGQALHHHSGHPLGGQTEVTLCFGCTAAAQLSVKATLSYYDRGKCPLLSICLMKWLYNNYIHSQQRK